MSTVTHGTRRAGWAIDDAVIRLREWGKRDGFDLPSDVSTLQIGAADSCTIRLQDDVGSISRQHAELTNQGGTWTLKDLGSKNGSHLDGERRLSFALSPGVEIEIGIGKIKLIAESRGLVELERFLARILGFSDARLAAIDGALRGIRDAAARRGTLFLCGAGSLVSTARRIHELALGTERPFVVADSSTLRDAVKSATAGTLCLEGSADPSDLMFAREAGASALFVCAPSATEVSDVLEHVPRPTIVELPRPDTRPDDREQLLLDYASDAASKLGLRANGFREHEMVWLRDVPLPSLEEVEGLTLRLVAQRVLGAQLAADRLKITRRALSEYLRRRGIPL